MNMLSLNICGTGSSSKRRNLCKLLNRYKINFLGLQETFITVSDLCRIRSMWGNYRFNFVDSLANGHSGGLLSMWDPEVFSK